MAFAMANTLQHTPAVASAVPALRRSAFTGAVSPLMPPMISRQSRTSICTPQALFTRNKQEDKVRLACRNGIHTHHVSVIFEMHHTPFKSTP